MMERKDKELRSSFDCGVCLEMLAMPVTTPCGHNFCKSCFRSLSNNSRIHRCPLCRLQLPQITPEVNLVLERVMAVLYPQDYNQRMSSSGSGNLKNYHKRCVSKTVMYFICISIPVIAGMMLCKRYKLPSWILSRLSSTASLATCARIWKTFLAIGYLLSCFVEVSSDIY